MWIAGCGSGIGEPESKMTSYTANESASDTAQLFTVPQQEMAHIKVVSVEKTRLQRVLRLTRSVSYNQFKTIPVFSAIGGPVHEILVAPRQVVSAGAPLLTVNSPDYSVEEKALEIKRVLGQTKGFTELTVVRELGQPSVVIDADRQKIARYGINVADVEM